MDADSNLTIGAVFDKAQLDASMAEGSAAIQKIPEAFAVAFQEVSTANQRALRQISDDTKVAATSVSEQWRAAAAASAEYTAAQREVRAASRLVADGSGDETAALNLLAAAKQRATAAAVDLAAAEKAAGSAAVAEAGTNELLGETLDHLRERFYLTSEGIRGSLLETGSLSGALGALIGAGFLGEFIDKLKDADVELSNFSSASGIDTSRLATLEAALEAAGAPADSLTTAIQRLEAGVERLRLGNVQAAQEFAQLGINIGSVLDGSLPLDQVILQISRHLKENADAARDGGAAQQLLGRGSLALIGALMNLNEEELKVGSAAEALGEAQEKAVPAARAMTSATADLYDRIKTLGQGFIDIGSKAAEFADGIAKAAGSVHDALQGDAAMGILGNAGLQPGSPANPTPPPAPFGSKPGGQFAGSGGEFSSETDKQQEAVTRLTATILAADAAGKNHTQTLEANAAAIKSLATTVSGEASPALQKYADQLKRLDDEEERKSKEAAAKLAATTKRSTEEIARIKNEGEASAGRAMRQYADDQRKYLEDETSAFEKANSAQIASTKAAIADEKRANAEYFQQQAEAITASASLAKAKLQERVKASHESGQQQLAEQLAINQQERDALVQLYAQELSLLSQSDANYLAEKQRIEGEIAKANQQFAARNVQAQTLASQQVAKVWQSGFQQINRTLDESVRGIIQGTQTISMAWRRMATDMLASTVENLAKIALLHVQNELTKTAAAEAGTQARVAITAEGAAEEGSIGLIATLKEITRNAVKAATAAYNAMAGIPIIGPELGAVAAATTFAAVEGFGALASAQGGQWSVPGNQLTMLHAQEMVLPASHAEPLRQFIDAGAGAANSTTNHLTVHATDSQSVERLFRRNGAALAKTANRLMRNRQLGATR